jgi:hypothetical protein
MYNLSKVRISYLFLGNQLQVTGFKEIIEKIRNYKQKSYFFGKGSFLNQDRSQNLTKSFNLSNIIDNNHKYFDYNMKYYYSETTGDNRTHYGLLHIVEEYYNTLHYEHCVDILNECIKLDQSNCDHEGLVKCFIWLHKIFRNLGQFETVN